MAFVNETSVVRYTVTILILSLATMAGAQDYGSRLGTVIGGRLSHEPAGPGVLFGALDPTVRNWYLPQELFDEHRWRQWEVSKYATNPYNRYVPAFNEGERFYDFYGDFISQGWLLYDWRQDQPGDSGSSLFKGRQLTDWFQNVTVSSDSRGQHGYAITVGNQIRTTLTPMTFSKPTFNGVQADYVSDKYAATIIASRISNPAGSSSGADRTANSTSLVGGRATAQVGDFVTIGGTLVDARNSNTNLDLFGGNLAAGNLTRGQSSTPVTVIAVILSDDSPEDATGGAALFNHDIQITSRDFTTGDDAVWRLDQVVRADANWPEIFGGFNRGGYLAADGNERIVLNYDFSHPDYIGPDPTSIVAVEFDYVLANDYKVEVWSDHQPGIAGLPRPPLTSVIIDAQRPALLPVVRAEGNVQDVTNIRRVSFDYGLPTANMIAGFTIEGADILGVHFYGEWDRNFRYSQYPNVAVFNNNDQHEISRRTSDARYFTVSKQHYPLFLYGEAYALDADYSTGAFIVDAEGSVEYDDLGRHRYEFVEDNDDQDRLPDWGRPGSQAGDLDVFPGWDENYDFISDFNQNDNKTLRNAVPDYEEPFLRHDVDRPEFLFGIDLNNNAWIDRFEDDTRPDYPYQADRKGFNAFGGIHLSSSLRLMAGRLDERMFTQASDNRTTYGLITLDESYRFGRLRVFDMLKRARDTIPDDRLTASPFLGATPRQRPLVEDILPAQDAWINTAWIGFDYTAVPNLKVINKVKHEVYHQVADNPLDASGRTMDGSTSFLGWINKVEYDGAIGSVTFEPKTKIEYLRREPFVRESLLGQVLDTDQEHWMGSLTLLARFPYLQQTTITSGLELTQFIDRVVDEDRMVADGIAEPTGDERSINLAVQLTTKSAYQGYWLTTQLGFRVARILTEHVRADELGAFGKVNSATTETVSFITVYAGVN